MMQSERSSSLSSTSLFDDIDTEAPLRTSSLQSLTQESTQLCIRIHSENRSAFNATKIMSAVSQCGEVQNIDLRCLQFDSTFTVSYFDIRAATQAKSSLRKGNFPGFSLREPDASRPLYAQFESPSRPSRNVDVIGFPGTENGCNELLLAVFGRFGEVETVIAESSDSFKIVFFDSRSPLAVLAALSGDSKTFSENVVVSSEQLVTLLLAGTQLTPTSVSSEKRPATNASTEFLIQIRDVEAGIDLRSTVMIRNIPRCFSQTQLMEIIRLRFGVEPFDFLYLPLDLVNRVNVGYVFINFESSDAVIRCLRLFNGKTWRAIVAAAGMPSVDDSEMTKVARVSFARMQGLNHLTEHFSKSSIMQNQPDHIRPYFKSH